MNQEDRVISQNWNDKTCEPMINWLPVISKLLIFSVAYLKEIDKKSHKKLNNKKKKHLSLSPLHPKAVSDNTVPIITVGAIVLQELCSCREPIAARDYGAVITWETWTCRTRLVWENQKVIEMKFIMIENIFLITAVLAAPAIVFVAWRCWQNTMSCPPYALMLTDTVTGDSEVCSIRGRPSELQNKRLGKF